MNSRPDTYFKSTIIFKEVKMLKFVMLLSFLFVESYGARFDHLIQLFT